MTAPNLGQHYLQLPLLQLGSKMYVSGRELGWREGREDSYNSAPTTTPAQTAQSYFDGNPDEDEQVTYTAPHAKSPLSRVINLCITFVLVRAHQRCRGVTPQTRRTFDLTGTLLVLVGGNAGGLRHCTLGL